MDSKSVERRLAQQYGDANSLLRSAYAIAKRKGDNTNWDAFERNLREILLKQAGVTDIDDEQTIKRAIVTPLTYGMRTGGFNYE